MGKNNDAMLEIAKDSLVATENIKLDKFKPTEKQQVIIDLLEEKELVAVQGSSGTGKSTTVIYKALDLLKRGKDTGIRKIVFIKTPVESSDDAIGFLPNSAEDKISVHMESMRSIFHTFMSKEKLLREEKNGRIEFTIPNFVQGKTFDNTLIIIDEGQQISNEIMKLLLERVGVHSKIALLGDLKQRYAFKKRTDGFTNFVDMITELKPDGTRTCKEDLMGFVHLSAKDNMRSDLSRRIVELYEEE